MVTRMPKITRCTATQCAYNKDEHCHALGITVGDGECPLCDTAFPSAMKGGADNVEGSVGACRATDCKFNDSLECGARSIEVTIHHDHAECETYSEI